MAVLSCLRKVLRKLRESAPARAVQALWQELQVELGWVETEMRQWAGKRDESGCGPCAQMATATILLLTCET